MHNRLWKAKLSFDKKSIGRGTILLLIIGLITLAAIAAFSLQAKDIIISYFDHLFGFFR